MKWFKGATEKEIVPVKEKEDKMKFVSNKLHRSLIISTTADADHGKYWCQVGKHKCGAYYRVIRTSHSNWGLEKLYSQSWSIFKMTSLTIEIEWTITSMLCKEKEATNWISKFCRYMLYSPKIFLSQILVNLLMRWTKLQRSKIERIYIIMMTDEYF